MRVTKGSPADEAELRRGDLIAEVNGKEVADAKAVVDAVTALDPGDRVTLTVYRSGQKGPIEVQVTLGEHPDQKGKAYLGVELGSLSFSQKGNDEDIPFPFRLPFDRREFRRRFEFRWPPRDRDTEVPELRGDSL